MPTNAINAGRSDFWPTYGEALKVHEEFSKALILAGDASAETRQQHLEWSRECDELRLSPLIDDCSEAYLQACAANRAASKALDELRLALEECQKLCEEPGHRSREVFDRILEQSRRAQAALVEGKKAYKGLRNLRRSREQGIKAWEDAIHQSQHAHDAASQLRAAYDKVNRRASRSEPVFDDEHAAHHPIASPDSSARGIFPNDSISGEEPTISSTSASSLYDIPPLYSLTQEPFGAIQALKSDADPQIGQAYLIVDTINSVAITLTQGTVHLVPLTSISEGGKWICRESAGWLHFQNAVSGSFLTHRPDRSPRLQAGDHDHARRSSQTGVGLQGFQIRRHPAGGYSLMVMAREDGSGLWRIEGREGYPAATAEGEGTAWEFVWVEV